MRFRSVYQTHTQYVTPRPSSITSLNGGMSTGRGMSVCSENYVCDATSARHGGAPPIGARTAVSGNRSFPPIRGFRHTASVQHRSTAVSNQQLDASWEFHTTKELTTLNRWQNLELQNSICPDSSHLGCHLVRLACRSGTPRQRSTTGVRRSLFRKPLQLKAYFINQNREPKT